MFSGNNDIENIKASVIIPYRMTNIKSINYIHLYITTCIVILASLLIYILNKTNNFNIFVRITLSIIKNKNNSIVSITAF